jgi:hypothetical protein
MYQKVQKYINDDSTTTLAVIKDVINGKIEEILQAGLLRFALRDTTITTVATTQTYYLPSDLDKIVDIRQIDTPLQLKRIWIGDFDRLFPYPTENGKPQYYMELLEDRVKGQPTTTSKVVMRSTSSQDITGQTGSTKVSIYGVSGGEDRTELVTLSATNVISSTNTYSKLYAITPDIDPVGSLRFTQATVGTSLLDLYPGEISRSYKKIQLYPIPDSAYTMYIRYQAKQPKLINDSDSPVIPDRFTDVIVNMSIGEMLLKQGDSKAAIWVQLGQQGVAGLLKEQELMYDYVPALKHMDMAYSYTDMSNPFTWY